MLGMSEVGIDKIFEEKRKTTCIDQEKKKENTILTKNKESNQDSDQEKKSVLGSFILLIPTSVGAIIAYFCLCGKGGETRWQLRETICWQRLWILRVQGSLRGACACH